LIALGRNMWLINGAARLKNTLAMGFPGLASGELAEFISALFSKKYVMVVAGRWREKIKKIIKNAPYDFVGGPLPYTFDLIMSLDKDIYDNVTFLFNTGDLLTDFLRNNMIGKVMKFGKIAYTIDFYGLSETIFLAVEIPPTIVKCMQDIPETHVALLKKENGELIHLFDAKAGDRGELIVTPLYDYMVPNYFTGDLVEIIDEESKFGLPTYRVLGRIGMPVDLELETLGHIKGVYMMYLRVRGITIDGYAYTNLLGDKFDTDHITLIEERERKVVLRTYVDKKIDKEDLLMAIKEDKRLYYLYEDIMSGVIDIEIIADKEVIKEIKIKTYEKFGAQATVPRIILLSQGEK